MKDLVTLVLFLLFVKLSIAQDIWEPSNFPDTTHILSICVNKQGYIFVGVGKNVEPGGIYRSINDATTWEYCGLINKKEENIK